MNICVFQTNLKLGKMPKIGFCIKSSIAMTQKFVAYRLFLKKSSFFAEFIFVFKRLQTLNRGYTQTVGGKEIK